MEYVNERREEESRDKLRISWYTILSFEVVKRVFVQVPAKVMCASEESVQVRLRYARTILIGGGWRL